MFGHAIRAAEIATIRDRHAQVGDRAGERIDEGGMFGCDGHWGKVGRGGASGKSPRIGGRNRVDGGGRAR